MSRQRVHGEDVELRREAVKSTLQSNGKRGFFKRRGSRQNERLTPQEYRRIRNAERRRNESRS